MLDQLDDLYLTSKFLLPWSTFVIGFVGSLHCVGMCGGLVMSCSPTPTNNSFYQLGRLVSYSFLALLAGFLGNYFSFSKTNPIASVVPALIIGLMLIWIGLRHFIKNSNQLKLPVKLSALIHKTWGKILPKGGKAITKKTSFLIGSFSIMLPCGLLYGVILVLAAFNNPLLAWLCIFTFWVGTLPAMGFAPDIIKRFLRPLYQKLPVLTSTFMIVVGITTIAHRVFLSYQATGANCH